MLQDDAEDVGAVQGRELDELRRKAGLEVTISLPRDPLAIAEVLAALVRADIRRGVKVSPEGLRYKRDKGGDRWDAPEVVSAKGSDDCDGLVRAAGTSRAAFVACVRAPGSDPKRPFHVFLLDEQGRVDDPCVAAGMPAPNPSAYEGASKARIRTPEKLPARLAARRIVQRARVVRPGVAPGALMAGLGEIGPEERVEILRELEPVLAELPAGEAEQIRATVRAELGINPPRVEGVDGLFGDIVQAAGTVAAVVVSAAATPVAGAAVLGATTVVAKVVSDAESKAGTQAKPHPKNPQRKDPAAIRAEAQQAAAKAPAGSPERKAAQAVVYATTADPRAIQRLRLRLRVPIAKDPNLEDRARLLATIKALTAAGYRLPAEDDREARKPKAPAPGGQSAASSVTSAPAGEAPRRRPQRDDYEEEEDLSDYDDEELEALLSEEDRAWLAEVEGMAVAAGKCPGVCAVR